MFLIETLKALEIEFIYNKYFYYLKLETLNSNSLN